MPPSIESESGAHVLVIGAGGNIGSHAIPLLARSPYVRRLTLVDPDVYEAHNLTNQAIVPAMLYQPKVQVQMKEAQRINPALPVVAHRATVEDLPLGALRADLVLTCLDGRRSRLYVNDVAWRLGMPWIDAGVLANDLMARVDLYIPGPAAPCLQCTYGDADYAAVEQRYPCRADAQPTPTNTPAALGALAAAMQVLEGERILRGDAHGAGLRPGEQVVLSAEFHRHLRTARRRNPTCRMVEHAPWTIEHLALGRRATTTTLLGALGSRMERGRAFKLQVFGRHFARSATCPECGTDRALLRLTNTAATHADLCPTCLVPALVSGFGRVEYMDARELLPLSRQLSLRALGIGHGDVVTAFTRTTRRHFEIDLKTGPHSPVPTVPRSPAEPV